MLAMGILDNISADPVSAAILAALTACLVWASISDLRHYRIPNAAVLATAGLGSLHHVHEGTALASVALVAGIALAIGFAIYFFKLAGAGDAKLFAAVALVAGPAQIVPLTLHMLLIGGVLAILWLRSAPLRYGLAASGIKIDLEVPPAVPYGVAIAGSGLLMVVRLWPGA